MPKKPAAPPSPKTTKTVGDVLVTATPRVLKELARAWFLKGFACSGYRAHGEIPRVADNSAFGKLLDAEFERAWSERRDAPPPAPPRSVTSG